MLRGNNRFYYQRSVETCVTSDCIFIDDMLLQECRGQLFLNTHIIHYRFSESAHDRERVVRAVYSSVCVVTSRQSAAATAAKRGIGIRGGVSMQQGGGWGFYTLA